MRYEDKTTTTPEGHRDPETIQRDIQQTRQSMDRTLEAIENKLTPQEIIGDLVARFRGSRSTRPDGTAGDELSTGDILSVLGRTIKDNPIPAALIGIGALALLKDAGPSSDEIRYRAERARVRARSGDQHGVYTDRHGHSYVGVRSDGSGDGQGIVDRAKDAAGNVKDAAGNLVGKARDAASGAADRAQGSASSAKGTAQGLASSAKGKAQGLASSAKGTAHDVGSTMQDAAGTARDHVTDAADSAGDMLASGYEYARERIDENPIVLGALGIALGAALGAGIPRTRIEDETLGEYRDDLVSQAKDVAQEVKEGAKDVASEAASAAKSQAESEGVHADGVKQAARSAAKTVRNVAEAAGDAAKKKAKERT